MSERSKDMMMSGPATEMGRDLGLQVGNAQFFRIGLDHSYNNGRLFLRPKINGYATEKFTGDFEKIIEQYVFRKKEIPGGYKEKPTPSQIGRTHLSLHGYEKSYIVIELDKTIEWKFAEYSTPFSTAIFHRNKEVFSDPTLCWAEGGVHRRDVVTSLGTIGKNEKTNWAYFIFNRAPILASDEDGFSCGFNIHVALYPDDIDSPPIPITIDPDVGHPGGQGN